MKLTDAGLETVLVFEERFDLPHFAAFPLVDSEDGRAALRRYYGPFLELARDREVPLILSAPTWRANTDWGRLLGYEGDDLASVNRRAVEFLEGMAADYDEVVVEGSVGPRSDAYNPAFLMDADEAERYHAAQLRTLADAGCAQATALTLAYPDEGVGIARAATAAGIPIVVGFTVETDGRLPSGDSIEDAILAVDNATDGAAEFFVINCAHPTHFADALPEGDSRRRLRGLRANASRLSHAELDEAEELDSGNPDDLAQRYVALRSELPNLEVVGGCCGTDIRHVTAICDAWLAAG
ncbi:MAG TPA: homocysteine S-methyltransferase family protein [Gaiellaceae bacterium]|nr:homocysteine S-methyltransferase family protein [Gaiellaceae bacterium]